MNDQRKFLIKKSNSFVRPKIPSELELNANSQEIGDAHEQGNIKGVVIDGLKLSSKIYKNIGKIGSFKYPQEIFVSKMSPESSKIVTTHMEGSISVLSNHSSLKSVSKVLSQGVPITCVAFVNETTFYAGDTNGNVFKLEINQGIDEIKMDSPFKDPTEQMLAMEYLATKNILIYGGKIKSLSLVDESTMKILSTFSEGDSYTVGHTNRIFCITKVPGDDNMFISGGWDGTMFMWDIRSSNCVRTVFGPNVSGDSLDIKGNLILAGSYRERDSLELYDFKEFKKICNVDWNLSKSTQNFITSCKFQKGQDSDLFIAGSSLTNQVGIFKKDIVYNQVLSVVGIRKPVHAVGLTNKEKKFYFSTIDGEVSLYSFKEI